MCHTDPFFPYVDSKPSGPETSRHCYTHATAVMRPLVHHHIAFSATTKPDDRIVDACRNSAAAGGHISMKEGSKKGRTRVKVQYSVSWNAQSKQQTGRLLGAVKGRQFQQLPVITLMSQKLLHHPAEHKVSQQEKCNLMLLHHRIDAFFGPSLYSRRIGPSHIKSVSDDKNNTRIGTLSCSLNKTLEIQPVNETPVWRVPPKTGWFTASTSASVLLCCLFHLFHSRNQRTHRSWNTFLIIQGRHF